MRKQYYYGIVAILIIGGILLQPWQYISQYRLWANDLFSPRETTLAQNPSETDVTSTIHLPVIMKPPGPPAFEIISPQDGWQVSGSLFFAIQSTSTNSVSSVSFSAGGTNLGTDNTPADGFKVFFDANNFPSGNLQLTATANGPMGTTSKSITVQVVPNPPSSGIINSPGGVLASEIGSIITFPPDAVPDGTSISVDELTQEEVSAQNGIDWESMGVTFLGAQEIQSNAEFSKPIRVASANFGSRVQPGQAVVNYRIIPDSDGDGIDEIIVVNSASVTSNGDVISDPITQVAISSDNFRFSKAIVNVSNIVPGTEFEVDIDGLNPSSTQGNIVRWIADSDQTVYEIPGLVEINNLNQTMTFSSLIPTLPSGNATYEIINEGTGSASLPNTVFIGNPPNLNSPPDLIIRDFLQKTKQTLISTLSTSDPQIAIVLEDAISDIEDAELAFEQIANNSPSPEDIELMNDVAIIIQTSGILEEMTTYNNNEDLAVDKIENTAAITALPAILGGVIRVLLTGKKIIDGYKKLNQANNAWQALSRSALLIYSKLKFAKQLADLAEDNPSDCTPSPQGDGSNNQMTGMGSVPPPGGSGCGNVISDGGASNRILQLNESAGQIIIKVFSGGSSIPFSGMVDDGGYFFIPLIPADEPFTAIAFDTETGQVRTFEGIGPPIGESVFMFFDFIGTGNTIQLQYGKVVTGSIDFSTDFGVYSFEGATGDEVLFSVTPTSAELNPDFDVYRPDGTRLCGAATAGNSLVQEECTLDAGGTYTILVGDWSANDTGTYELYLQRLNDPANFVPINYGQVTPGSIDLPVEKDTYTFMGANTDQVLFSMTPTSADLNPEFDVYRPDGTRLCGAATAGNSLVQEECTLDAGGTYTILVGDWSANDTGTYELYLQRLNDPVNFVPINYGQVTPGSIDLPVEKDTYTFMGANTDQVLFSMTPTSADLTPEFDVYRPDGTRLCGAATAGNSLVQEECTLDAGGTYTILVGDWSANDTGTYELYLQRLNDPANFVPINYGQVTPGSIDLPVEKDTYTFMGANTDQVLFSMTPTSADLNPEFDVYRPDGTRLCGAATAGNSLVQEECTLDAGGTYTILVGDWSANDTGTYELLADKQN